MAEDTADAAEKRISELDTYKQRSAAELEGLRAELHEAQRVAREETANCAEAVSARKLAEVDSTGLSSKHYRLLEDHKSHALALESLRNAMTASTGRADHLETKLEEERQLRIEIEQQHLQLKSEHSTKLSEIESITRQLKDSRDLADKHAEEARTHREAVL